MFDNVCEPGYHVETPVSRAFVGRRMLSAASCNKSMMGAFWVQYDFYLVTFGTFRFLFFLLFFLLFSLPFHFPVADKLGQDQSSLRQTRLVSSWAIKQDARK